MSDTTAIGAGAHAERLPARPEDLGQPTIGTQVIQVEDPLGLGDSEPQAGQRGPSE
ncbi:hypothetical protein ACIHDR_03500 [Nocardia sp. NPDC052278]|uniref:hypothetical protein n=1 Tax=unclassified Nocardia TaxID=2637762 RepID=UPI0036D0DC4C